MADRRLLGIICVVLICHLARQSEGVPVENTLPDPVAAAASVEVKPSGDRIARSALSSAGPRLSQKNYLSAGGKLKDIIPAKNPYRVIDEARMARRASMKDGHRGVQAPYSPSFATGGHHHKRHYNNHRSGMRQPSRGKENGGIPRPQRFDAGKSHAFGRSVDRSFPYQNPFRSPNAQRKRSAHGSKNFGRNHPGVAEI